MSDKTTAASALTQMVTEDTRPHVIKEMARLFIAALLDWPSMNPLDVNDFVNELKSYFGSPLTIEKLTDAKLDMHTTHYWWKRESASSLIKMLQLSHNENSISDFDQAIKSIFDYYEIEMEISK